VLASSHATASVCSVAVLQSRHRRARLVSGAPRSADCVLKIWWSSSAVALILNLARRPLRAAAAACSLPPARCGAIQPSCGPSHLPSPPFSRSASLPVVPRCCLRRAHHRRMAGWIRDADAEQQLLGAGELEAIQPAVCAGGVSTLEVSTACRQCCAVGSAGSPARAALPLSTPPRCSPGP
jgi:hypothetical protein